MVSSVVSELRLHLKSNRYLYPLLKRLRDPRSHSKLCGSHTDFCLEGYTSSGNSFAYNYLRILFPNLEIAHHCHSIANVKNALARNVPCLILLRDPRESISSRVIRFHGGREEISLRPHVREYNWFYRGIRQLQERTRDPSIVLRIRRFEDAVNDPSLLSAIVVEDVYDNQATRTDEECTFARDLARKCIEEWTHRRGTSDDPSLTMSLPSRERDRLKGTLRERLADVEGFPEALDLYEELSGRTPSTPQS